MYIDGEIASGKVGKVVGNIVSKVNTLKLVGLLTSSVRMKLYLRMFVERKDSLDGYLIIFMKSILCLTLYNWWELFSVWVMARLPFEKSFLSTKSWPRKIKAVCCCSNICQRSHTISKWPRYWFYPPEIQLSRSLEALFALYPLYEYLFIY